MDDNYKHPVDEKKIRFKPNANTSKGSNGRWIIMITVLSFMLSATLSFMSSIILEGVSYIVAILVVLVIIFIGILFDMIGIAVTAADEVPFHSMASRRLYGAKQSIRLIRNANRVSSFCNDVVGDICGIISGAASGMVIATIAKSGGGAELLTAGMVASLTVGGKAVGKTFAIENSNYIVYKVSVVLAFFNRTGLTGNKKK